MKTLWKLSILITLFFSVLLITQGSQAKIRFKTTRTIELDLEKLNLGKDAFFSYVTKSVHGNPFGLQAYGQVPFHVCDFKLNGRKLFDYKSHQGRENRYMSNPSCDQIVVRRLLENSFNYKMDNLSSYKNRMCMRSIERIFSPLLEYYTILYEEKSQTICIRCDEKEQERMDKIVSIQEKITENYLQEQEKVMQFLNELDGVIEAAFKSKKISPPK